MIQQTALHDVHVSKQAKMVDFFGWHMPLHYGSQLAEHHHVRTHAGVFDVSHMGIIDIQGEEAAALLSYVLANNIQRIGDGQALYSCLLNDEAGIIDDLIAYRLHANWFRLIVNAATTAKDFAWIKHHAASFRCTLHQPTHLALLAVQGPAALSILSSLLKDPLRDKIALLKPFQIGEIDSNWMIACTGYTGEQGYEIILPNSEAAAFFNQLCDAGVAPCGLGARDTLRLEAGLNLYGADMDETISPDECNLAWTISLNPETRHFIGKTALLARRTQPLQKKLVGIVLQDKGIARSHQTVWLNHTCIGELTSAGYSPTLNLSIGFARIHALDLGMDDMCSVEIRGKKCSAAIVKLPFVRHGKSCLMTSLNQRN